MSFRPLRALFPALLLVALAACSAGTNGNTGGAGGTAGTGLSNGSGANGSTGSFGTGSGGGTCGLQCTTDLHTVIDCNGTVVASCAGDQGCDVSTGTCKNACQSAETNHLSVGCDYYATDMDQIFLDVCFASYVANTWNTPVHIKAEWNGQTLDVGQIARIPVGSGPSLTYQPYDPVAGLPPGQVAILFLAGGQGFVPCPVPSGVPTGAQFQTTDIGHSFHITTDVPVVTYQINPYGGGSAATTAASLLLPTSVWDTNYVAVNISPFDIANPSMNIIARDDNTTVTILPKVMVDGGGAVPPMPANQPGTVILQHGEHLQISQQAELTGSIISADKPIGFMAGQDCMRAPQGSAYCDHGEQMIPPVKALGSEYVGVMYRPRVPNETQTIWKLVGAVDGTQLTWSSNIPGAPLSLAKGQMVEFITGTPFVVKSQDDAHPFLLMTYMSSNAWVADGYGDPDLVVGVPPAQYLNRYVFFADPTYPETNLVVIRAKNNKGVFSDVNLDCAGVLGGWQPVGDYEWTRVDLSTGDFQAVGNCSTGAHEMKSDGRFGLWVWGWGTPTTSTSTRDVSYGYPGGMNALPINQVVIPPIPN